MLPHKGDSTPLGQYRGGIYPALARPSFQRATLRTIGNGIGSGIGIERGTLSVCMMGVVC
jgi:hypothetical protein